MKNVAFWSSTPQQGKTTAARFLVDNYDYVKVSFADPLRSMIERLLHSAGLSKQEAVYFMNEGKEQKIEPIGASFRTLARTLGTEWGRNCIHQDLWVDLAKTRLARFSRVCIDDVRFLNELSMLRSMGVLLVKIERSNLRIDTHLSDTALRDFNDWDHVVQNDGPLERFCSKIYEVVS